MHRYGEAENPGPPNAPGVEQDETAAMTVDEAWDIARADPTWVPAWKAWTREVVTGTAGGKLCFALRAPQVVEEGEGAGEGQVWEEEEWESFLQQCELEAGWREAADIGQGERLAREWREWEAEMTMAGIQCPRLEESTMSGGVRTEEAEIYDLEAAPTGGAAGSARRVRAEGGGMKRRRRWRPCGIANVEGEPWVEQEGSEELEADGSPRPREAQVSETLVAPRPEGPSRTARIRPRGRRQRGSPPQEFAVDLVTFNGSGAPQALEAMSVLSARKLSLGALLIQEHHGRGDSLADLQAGARARGMKLAANEATAGKGGGVTAGVGVATPTHRGWGGIFAASWDLSPVGSPGRLAGAWLQVGPRGGMVVLSVWCWPTEGMSQRKSRPPAAVHGSLAVTGMPRPVSSLRRWAGSSSVQARQSGRRCGPHVTRQWERPAR